ncbi:MAG: pyridoxamine 5'-phosphate oxidase [Bacteroidetes bacterium]|nr:pyridoxamine 5'-phosphate oxidase [Bacteroidota bacterium]
MEKLNAHISKLRTEYSHASLDESMVEKDPVRQFEKWFREAMDANVTDPIAMTLATAGKDMRPSARVVLLRDFSAKGFSFFTNYKSAKGKDIDENPFACLNFFWPELQRQVRIEGRIEKINEKDSEEYFSTRPLESRIGAWTSPQSEIIPDRKWLEEELNKQKKNFEGKNVHRPEFWGGYVLMPDEIEFWQGRESRLHDRICYVHANGGWKIMRKAP